MRERGKSVDKITGSRWNRTSPHNRYLKSRVILSHIPPIRKILKDLPSGKFGCVRLIGYGTEWEPDEWDMKIDRLLIQKNYHNY